MTRITSISTVTVVLLIAVILASGCTSGEKAKPASAPVPQGDALLFQGEKEFADNNLHAAFRLFTLAQENYTAAGNTDLALHARDRATIARMMTLEFPYNRSQIEKIIDEKFPDVPADRKASWLPCNQSQCIESDGEFWYYDETVKNIQWHNMDIMRNMTAAKGDTPFYDQLVPYAFAPAGQDTGNYINPMTWDGTGLLSIPSDKLPKTGTLRLWVPLPIETESQRDVTIISVEPAQYVRSQTGTDADIGIAYLEIPLESVTGSFLNVSTEFRFTSYEQQFSIDPEKVTSYNTSEPEYLKYTASSRNVALTPELRQEALGIVGNETNPYRKAQKIYWHVIRLYYGHPPYARNLANGTGQPMSEVVRTTGYGDCGAQSDYFAALCRAAGIPARALGGQQMVPGYGGRHIWSEYYLPGYGWIPNDVTVAEGAEWSYNATDAQRQRFKEFYSENLDPYRYIIQKNDDIPLVPDTKDLTMSVGAFQEPVAMCDTCPVDPKFWLPDYWKVTIKKV
jgi:transglutaminase-like putative cysteine protease